MRSIFVLLILVMIGLNGKGQSVTALPDSVLSQCCLEVTLLNGNVTTVDWVFIQYITRDGSGTKLFVEYAPNFGGIQWETQIRIQDNFDDVLERSKFIVIPFTVGSTDYGINRNWIANIEENTTTGGTWIYGRFGTPTKRKFSAVEDYETIKNLLLACRPRAIVVAENGLYTEGDTVRMGGFLIEDTRIETNQHPFTLIDTLTSQAFGLSYNSVYSDTAVYFARRWGKWRNLFQQGRSYITAVIEDTTGGDFIDWTIALDAFSDPNISFKVSNSAQSELTWLSAYKNSVSWISKNSITNPNYTASFFMGASNVGIGMSEVGGSGEPGNGVSVIAYGSGTSDEFIGITTKAVDNSTATVGQFLQLQDVVTGKVEFATIDLSGYLPIADTAAMLTKYPSTVGYGILKSGKTIRADTTKLATLFDISGFPSGSGIIDRSARWSATNTLAAGNITDNGTKLQALLPFQLQQWTTAGRPTGVNGYMGYNTSVNGIEWYNGTRWAYALESTFDMGTAGSIPFIDANGQLTQDNANLSWLSSTMLLRGTTPTIRLRSANTNDVMKIIFANASTLNYNSIESSTSGDYLSIRGWDGSGLIDRIYISSGASNRGSIGMGTSSPSSKAVLELSSTEKGILIPRMTTTQRNSITSPPNLLLIGNTTTSNLEIYDILTSSWRSVSGWQNFSGGLYYNSGTVGIGTASPNTSYSLHVNGATLLGGNTTLLGTSPTFLIQSATTNQLSKMNFSNGTQLAGFELDPVFDQFSLMGFNGSGLSKRLTLSCAGATQGYIGVNQALPKYIFDINSTNALGLPRGAVSTRPTISSSTTPFRFNTDSTALEYGESVGVWRQISTRDYARSLVSGLATTWLKTELEAGQDVTINGVSSTDFRIQNSRIQFDGNVKVGVDSLIKFNTANDTSQIKSDLKIIGASSSQALITIGSVNTSANFKTQVSIGDVSKSRGWQLGIDAFEAGANHLYFYNNATGALPLAMINKTVLVGNFDLTVPSGLSTDMHIRATLKDGFVISNSGLTRRWINTGSILRGLKVGGITSFSKNVDVDTLYNYGTVRLDPYGTGTKEASDLSKTESVYNAIYATDGTLLEKRANTEQYNAITSTTSPVTLSSTVSDNLINQGGTQATFTLNMPASPVDGQIVMITYNNAISTLTVDGNGNTIVGSAVTTAVAGSQRKFKFYSGIGWIKQY